LIDELQALSKLDPPVAFNDRRVLELTEKYSDVIEEITEEIMLRKEYIELMQEDDLISAGGASLATGQFLIRNQRPSPHGGRNGPSWLCMYKSSTNFSACVTQFA